MANFEKYYDINKMKKEVSNYVEEGYKNGGQFNGRLFFKPNESSQPYNLYPNQNKNQNINDNIIGATIESNELTQNYFHSNNVNFIQNKIIQNIKNISDNQYNIGRQDDQQLHIIMRSYYLQYAKNIPNNIQSQIDELNKMVIDECVRIIIPNIQQYLGYRKDITNPIPVLPRSQNVSNKGKKTFSLLIT